MTHSVPSRQFRRSVSLPASIVAIAAAFILIAGMPVMPTQQLTDIQAGIEPGNDTTAGGKITDTSETTILVTPTALSTRTDRSPTSALIADTSRATVTFTDTSTPTPVSRSDTDADGLLDRWERRGEHPDGYALPNADPRHKDLYLQLFVSSDIKQLDSEEREDLREIWAQMPVSNPDGNTGIDLHIQQQTLESVVTYIGSKRAFDDLLEEYYTSQYLGNRACTAYLGLLVRVTDAQRGGRASAPGYFFIVDGTRMETYDTKYSVRTTLLTHELLHNIVGSFNDGTIHTDGGWLNHDPGVHGAQFFMSDKTKQYLSDNGFDESQYYRRYYC